MNTAVCLIILLPFASAWIRPALNENSLAHRSARNNGVQIAVVSETKGLGAFATSKIKVGDYIGAYEGEIMTHKQVRARFWGKGEQTANDLDWQRSRRERGQGITGNYVLEMRDGRFVDAEDADVSGWCRFMNHATEGTLECNVKAFDRLTANGDLLEFPQFFAIRDIEVGDELSWDYGSSFFSHEEHQRNETPS